MASLIRLRTVGPGVGVGMVVLWCAAHYGFWGGWHDIFARQTYQMEWVGVQVVAVVFLLLALWATRQISWLLGAITAAAAVLMLACQFGIAPVPSYRESVVPLQVGLLWFAVLGLAMLAHAIWSARRVACPPVHPGQHAHRA